VPRERAERKRANKASRRHPLSKLHQVAIAAFGWADSPKCNPLPHRSGAKTGVAISRLSKTERQTPLASKTVEVRTMCATHATYGTCGSWPDGYGQESRMNTDSGVSTLTGLSKTPLPRQRRGSSLREGHHKAANAGNA
jgi:hypothetical protein